MEKINFENGITKGNATTFNQMQANIENALKGGSLLEYNGYHKFDNGLILQWGHTKYTFTKQKEFTIAFPIVFPNVCLNVTGNISDVGFGDCNLTTGVGIYTFNPINFSGTIKSNYASEQKDIGVYWIAIGY